jgi:hypothetical protein
MRRTFLVGAPNRLDSNVPIVPVSTTKGTKSTKESFFSPFVPFVPFASFVVRIFIPSFWRANRFYNLREDMRSRTGLRVLLTGVAFILTACTMSITAKVNPDGSGEIGFAYKLTEDDKETFAGMGMSNMDDLCGQLSSQGNESLPVSLNLRQEKHGSETWCVARQRYNNLEGLRRGLGE